MGTAHSRGRMLTFGIGLLILAPATARAEHINAPVIAHGIRTPMPNEGYLRHSINPSAGRFGEEWTGWVDVRHPAMNGTTQTFSPFDRSNRYVDVKTITVSDNLGVAAAPNIARDFDYANKIYAQAGISIIRERDPGNETLALNGAGGAPTTAWPMNQGAHDDAMKALKRSANATTINNYYVQAYDTTAPTGLTSPSTPFGANVPRNDGMGLANTAVNNTLAHELGHMLMDAGNASHTPGDATNLMFPTIANSSASFNDVGPAGGHDVITKAQMSTMFSNPGANNPGFVQVNGEDHRYGNRVDWNFVVDHSNLEDVGNGADNHLGLDSLYYEIGVASAPTATSGQDQTGLDSFTHPGSYTEQTFQYVDVFSMALRYSDFDRDATGQQLQDAAQDYNVSCVAPGGAITAATPVTAFEWGWTISTDADNFLTRWMCDTPSNALYVYAENGSGHDGIAQIDAVIVSNIPEPATLLLLSCAGLVLCRRRR